MAAKSKTILNKQKAQKLYAKAGVNEESASDLVSFIKKLSLAAIDPAAKANIGDFAGLFDLKEKSFIDPLLVASSDGVGSKILLATEANYHKNIGIDLVAMCVNDLLAKGATPLFFLDYFAVNKLNPERDKQVLSSIIKGCKIAGCSLLGGETAQLADLYREQEYDLAGFAVGAVERDKLLPKRDLKTGDIILGLSSNGLHANGFSLVRQVLKTDQIKIHESPEFTHPAATSLVQLLLAPTRIYVNPVAAALKKFDTIKAVAHITGGGILGNIPRILPTNLAARLNLADFPTQPIFSWLAKKLYLNSEAMLSIFNCGIGLTIIVKNSECETVKNFLTAQGESVHIIGELVNKSTAEPIILENTLCDIISNV